MKILIVSYAFAPNVGGLERVAETLNQGFLDLGHTIQVITHYLGETQHPYSIFRRPSFQKTYSLARRADIVLFHNMSLQYALPVFLSRRPVICVSHGDYGFVDSNLRGTLLRFFLKCSTNVAVSHYVAGRLPKASTVIRNPFERSKGDSLGFIDRSGDVLFVGRLVRGKGAHILIQAMHAWLSTDVPNLTVVGDGPEMDALQSLVLELGLKRVTFRGSLAKEEVALVMDSHRVLAVPSVTSEGFGMVAVEGIAAGCIPIASDIGGLAEAVGPCGILVKPNDREGLRDAIACVLDDRNLVERYTERASEFLAQFRGVHVLEQYEELLGKTAGSQRSR